MDVKISVSVPKELFTVDSINALYDFVDTNETLIKLATGAKELLIEIEEDKVTFPWFNLNDRYTVNEAQEMVLGICKTVTGR